MDPNAFLKGRTRETTIVRDARGRWFFEGQPLTHPNLVKSFDSWVGRAEDGRYCLSNDINWAYITLEGPPHFVRAVEVTPAGVRLQLSNGKAETLRPASLRQDRDGALYCDVGAEPLTARFDSTAAVGLSDLLKEDERGVYIELDGQQYRPPVTDSPIA